MLPDPEPGVAGVIDHDGHTYVVVESLGTGGRHVLLARVGGKPLGLLVDEAVGIAEIDPAALRPRPPGQRRDLIEATHGVAADLTFVLDPRELVAEFDTPKEMVR